MAESAKWVRYGAECYDFGLLASGFTDVYIDAGLQVHDFAPLDAVVRNAVGTVTGWNGDALTTSSDGRVLDVADRRLLDDPLARLRDPT